MQLKSIIFAASSLLALPVLADSAVKQNSAASSVEQKTPAERRAAIDQAAQDTLAQVYKKFPSAKSQIAKASAYAVFRTGGFQAVFVGAGGGDGVAVASGKRTYMDMLQGKVGLGLGAKETREVWVFTSNKAYNKFVTSGWSASGQAGAAAKAGKTGGQIAGAKYLGKDVYVYQFTENGLTAEATVNGAKYMVNRDLNKK